MSDQPVAPPWSFSTDIIDTWKMKAPFTTLTLPPQFLPAIGRVATGWGFFETIFENLLIAFQKAHGVTDENWRGLNFRRRRTLFRERMNQVLTACPTAIRHLESVLDDIEPLYRKRNLAVHGRMSMHVRTFTHDGKPSGEVKLVCEGRYRGVEIREDFTLDELDDLYYEIGHLNGRLNAVGMGDLGLPPSSPETRTLRAFLSSNHPTYPMPRKLPSPP